jgi:hypothetical protein
LSIYESFKDENRISLNDETIEICRNDVIMENKFEKNPSVQTKVSKNEKMERKELMKI